MLLTGRTWESLNLRDATDVVYVALVEPQLNGSMTSLGELLKKWDEALEDAVLDRDTFGTSSRAQAEFEKADKQWGQARKLDGPRKKRNRRDDRRVVGSGNPLDAGVLYVMRAGLLAEQQRESPPD